MSIRGITDADQVDWRLKGTEKAKAIIADVYKEFPNDDKPRFYELHRRLGLAHAAAVHCSENFNSAGDYKPKDGKIGDRCNDLGTVMEQQLKCTVVKAEVVQEKLYEALEACAPAKYNGEKAICNDWAQKLGLSASQGFIPPESAIVIHRDFAL